MAKRYTYTELRTLEATGKQLWYYWPGTPGLTFAMTPAGRKSWILRYGGKKPIVFTLDAEFGKATLEQAKEEAVAKRRMLLQGIDPRKVEAPAPPPAAPKALTLDIVWEKYKVVHLPKVSIDHQEFQEDVWTRLVQPFFAGQPIKDIDSGMVNNFLDGIGLTRKAMANKIQSLISELWRIAGIYWPKEEGTRLNPVWGRKKYKIPVKKRSLEPQEWKPWGQAWMECPREDKYLLMFQLLCGCRDGVMLNYDPQWRVDEGTLFFPEGTRGVKLSTGHVIPKAAQPLIAKFVESDHYRLNRTCKWITRHSNMPHLAPHSLRKSFASCGEDMAEQINQLDSLIDHGHKGSRQAYFMQNVKPLRPVAERVSKRILKLLGLTAEDILK